MARLIIGRRRIEIPAAKPAAPIATPPAKKPARKRPTKTALKTAVVLAILAIASTTFAQCQCPGGICPVPMEQSILQPAQWQMLPSPTPYSPPYDPQSAAYAQRIAAEQQAYAAAIQQQQLQQQLQQQYELQLMQQQAAMARSLYGSSYPRMYGSPAFFRPFGGFFRPLLGLPRVVPAPVKAK